MAAGEFFHDEPSQGKGPDLSLAVPFYDEEPNVEPVLRGLTSALHGEGVSFEILAVDNGSGDRTGERIRAAAEADHTVRPVTVPFNRGYGYGVLQGLRRARGRVVGYTWGDGQVSPEDLLRVYRALHAEGADLSKAWRRERHDGPFRLIQTRIYAVVFTLLFGRRVLDPNGCPKLFRREALARIAPRASDWLLDPEIMVRAPRLGLRVTNVPVVFHRRSRGRSKVRPLTAFSFFLGLLRLRFTPEERWAAPLPPLSTAPHQAQGSGKG